MLQQASRLDAVHNPTETRLGVSGLEVGWSMLAFFIASWGKPAKWQAAIHAVHRSAVTTYNPALLCLLARDMGDMGRGHRTVDGGPEIGTGGLWLCQLGLIRRKSVLAFLARGLALINKPVLDCIWRVVWLLWVDEVNSFQS